MTTETTIPENTENTADPTPPTGEDVTGLKSANQKLLSEKKALAARLAALEANLTELAGEKAAREEEESIRRGDFDRVKTKMVTDHQNALKAAQEDAEKWRNAYQAHVVENTLVKALAAEQADVDLVLPHLQGRMKLAEVDGKVVTQIYDRDGTELPGKDAAYLVEEIKTRFPTAFRINTASPTNARPNTSVAAGETNPWAKETWNRSHQARIEMTDKNKAALLKAQANVK
ncbi:hypothetical protein JL100_017940 [Skermanella mucosa]|uniref:hypothetical protein n=1 Tax=Skermanella mucosa TaxID=1789672 RepID=UPI00192BCB22|nr:hypothetical protein [Skermanella mucosa]UEM18967.1 hypothetical protein JL100_017940 [Skermanella mucosa]